MFADFCGYRADAYLDPNRTSEIELFVKILKAVNYSRKRSILDVWLSSKYAFGGLCKRWSAGGTSPCSCCRVFYNCLAKVSPINYH